MLVVVFFHNIHNELRQKSIQKLKPSAVIKNSNNKNWCFPASSQNFAHSFIVIVENITVCNIIALINGCLCFILNLLALCFYQF